MRQAAAVLLLLAALPARAQDAAPPPPPAPAVRGPAPEDPAEKRERRERLARLAGPDAAVLVLSAEDSPGFTGSTQNTDFAYLCPYEARGAAILLAAGPGDTPAVSDRLYVRPRSPVGELWTGTVACPGAETAAAGRFDAALAPNGLAADLAEILRERRTLWISPGGPADGPARLAPLVAALRAKMQGTWVRLASLPGATPEDAAESVRRALPERLPESRSAAEVLAGLRAVDLRPAARMLSEMREVKSAPEIARIRIACEATVAGMRDALAAARPGTLEMGVAALVEVRCRLAGCARQAYPSIVGSGPNSCVLHYAANTRTMQAGELVVMDIGGEYRGYASDVTRTFPVGGKFTEEQARVYDAVLEAQLAGIAAVRPGATLRQVHQAAAEVLKRHGLAQYFPHGTSHSVGLDVHDPYRADEPLRAGCVITVEPGVYMTKESLGVRIEDTVLVTQSGCEVLSGALAKTREEIEQAMDAARAPR